MTAPPSKTEFSVLLQSELEKCSLATQQAASMLLIDPIPKTLKWEHGNCEEYQAWVFADLKENNYFAAYCLGGHGALGSPWGLVLSHYEYFGQDGSWYESLKDLLSDWDLGCEG